MTKEIKITVSELDAVSIKSEGLSSSEFLGLLEIAKFMHLNNKVKIKKPKK